MKKDLNDDSSLNLTSGLPPIARAHAEALRNLVREASERNAASSFVIEGPHLIERAFQSAPELVKEVIFTEEAYTSNPSIALQAGQKKIPCYHISAKLSERISDTKTPQGIFALVSIPRRSTIDDSRSTITIALDDVQDPGNVGTIIRTAAWFGVSQILLSKECADPYSSKVLRATQGEIFSTIVGNRGDVVDSLRILQKKGHQIIAATVDPSACLLYKMAFHENVVLVFGSEAHGVSREVLDLADGQIIIPKFGQGESLNVATSVGIILSEVMRKKQ
ncbi:MAG: TrmH family RNA methyltransferase [Candidatus Kapaibacterium sp.]